MKSEEYRKNMSEITKKTWENEERRKNMSERMKNLWENPEFKKNQLEKMKKAMQNPEYKKKVSIKAKKRWKNPEFKKNHSEKMKNLWENPEHRKNMSEMMKVFWENPEYKDKQSKLIFAGRSITPNKPETILINLFKEHNLPYKFVGDGDVILGGKSPDFINNNGEKKIIEMFGVVFHDPDKAVFPIKYHQTKQGTTEHYKKYGFQTLIVWDYELNDMSKVLEKIKAFEGT